MPAAIFMKLDMYTMAPEHISNAYFLNPSPQSVCLYISPIFARQQLGIHVLAATNTRVEELQDALFSMVYVSYQRKAGYQFFP
jgi:hypothetical protein